MYVGVRCRSAYCCLCTLCHQTSECARERKREGESENIRCTEHDCNHSNVFRSDSDNHFGHQNEKHISYNLFCQNFTPFKIQKDSTAITEYMRILHRLDATMIGNPNLTHANAHIVFYSCFPRIGHTHIGLFVSESCMKHRYHKQSRAQHRMTATIQQTAQ